MKTNIEKINVGKTCVRVMRVTIDERTHKQTTIVVHEGIVVQNRGPFVRVFNPAPRDKGGDISPEMSETFPLSGDRCWCEHTGERKVAFPIPPALR